MATPTQVDKLWLLIEETRKERNAVQQKLENSTGDEKQFWREFMLDQKKTLDEELKLPYGKLSAGTGMLEVRCGWLAIPVCIGALLFRVSVSFCAARQLPPSHHWLRIRNLVCTTSKFEGRDSHGEVLTRISLPRREQSKRRQLRRAWSAFETLPGRCAFAIG
jgi:hypothetical protein